MQLTKDYIIWLAGFFDGEGSVSIGINWHKLVKPPFRQKRYHLRCNVTQNVREVLAEAQSYFGGCLKARKITYKNTQRQIYDWAIDCLQGEKFLKTVYPFLKVKRKQAEIALDFQDMVNSDIDAATRRELGAKFKAAIEEVNSSKVWAS